MAISEEASRDYNKTDWSPGMPITEGRMDNIETGIDVNREAILALDTALTTNASTIGSQITALNSTVDGYSASNTIKSAIDDLRGRIGAIGTGSADGTAALTQIINALTNSEAVKYNDLKARLDAIEDMKKLFGKKLDPDDLTGTTYIDAFNTTDSTVYATITGLYNTISNLSSLISTNTSTVAGLATKITDATNYYTDPNLKVFNTLAERMNSLDDRIAANYNWIDTAKGDDETLAEHIARIYNDVINAHTSSIVKHTENGSEVDTTFNSLDERFETDEANIRANTQAITSLTQDTISILNGGIVDTFDSYDTDKALSANRGRILRNMIGGAYTGDGNSTVANAIANAQASAQTYADNNKVAKTDIYNDLDYEPALDATADKVLDARQGKALKDLIDTLDTDYQEADNALDTRLSSVEDELDDARIQIGVDENTQDPIMSTLDQRLDAMDTTAAGIRADLTTVIAELGMNDTNGLKTIGTRVDDLAENIATLATELDMQMSEGKITDTQSRIDDLAYDISHTATQEDNTVGLILRITTLETDLDTAENNISGLDQRLNKIDGGEALTGNTLVSRVSATETAINHAIGQAGADDKGGLIQRISTLEDNPASTTEVISVAAFNELAANEANSTKDYLVGPDSDNLYKYYRIIETSNDVYEKVLISGGGSGAGNSSGAFAPTLESITNPDINTDYFVGNNDDGYLHYRYITQENSETLRPVLIGADTNNIKRYNIERVLGKKREYNSETQTWTTTDEDVYYLNLYEFNYGVSNAQSSIEETMVPIGLIELPLGGGGGSTITTAPRVVRITPSNITTVLNESHIYLRFFYAAVDATGESYDSTYTLKYNNGSIIDSGTLNSGAYDLTVTTGVWPAAPRPVGFYEIDVTDYCRLGTQTFNLTVTVNGLDIPRAWTVNILELRLDSSATQSQLIEVGNTIQFPYTPYGAMTKTLYVLVDGTTIKTQPLGASVSGSELEVTIPSLTLGAHTISIYLEAVLDGETIPTPSIKRDYIWYNTDSENQIIIASPYRYAAISTIANWSEWAANTSYSIGDKVKITSNDSIIGYICTKANTDPTFNIDNWEAQVINTLQYEEIEIPYTIYNSEAATSAVKYYVNGTLLDTVSIANSGIFSYAFEEFGTKTIRIEVENTSLEFNVIVKEVEADIAPVPGAIINFDPATLTNTSVNRLPTWTYNNETYHMTVSDNFNWSNDISGGGYKEDADGKCFVIKAGTYAEFDYKMFKMAVDNSDQENPIYTSSVFDKGAEMKIIFKVSAVRDAGAVWFSNVGNPSSTNPMPIGILLNAHQGWLKTSAADAAEKQAQREGTVASTNSYLYFPYSEEDKIELDISINRTGNREDFIMSYEDGVPSKAYAYETAEILYHEAGNESVIRIGSPDCDVYIYKFRVYDKGLGTSEILRNFIADGKTVTDKVNRYNRNSIYYDSTKPEGLQFTPYKTGSAILDPEKLAEKMPDVKILMLEAPTFTKSKKTFVKSSLRCIHAPGGTVYPSRGDEDNWFFLKGYHSGQGTTSDNYGQSSRNVDFLFECDGINRPSDKVEAESGYVSTLIKGANKSVLNPTTKSWTPTVDAVVETCSGWKNDDAKISLTSTSIPNNYFNLKVNVASSENVNNALFQKRYNDFLPYISPAKARDNRVKNDMEFVPAILFIRETDTTQDDNGNYTKHLEFNDTEWHFYSLGNIGDSKKTDYTRAYDPTDENEFTVEISDNNTSNSQFQSGVYLNNNVRVVEEYDTGTLNSMNYIWDITDEEWNAQRDPTEKEIDHDYRVDEEIEKYEDGTDVENNLTHYILPNGKVYVNYRHRMLSGDPFDGDHTFEFRYASCGDYRDGKIVNPKKDDTDPERVARYKKNKAQEKLNRGIIEAFYEWLITASNDEFVDELAEWCVPEALEYFYAFTHFYTMMDNRAKNTFWHFAKTGTPRVVHHPHPALLHVYTELNNGEYEPTEDTEIDPEKTYYTEYAFDLWAYDMDTAAGIDNNGELIFPYGKEDTDYRQAGVSSSGYVFNGAGSIIWRRLSLSFTNEIADIFDRVNEQSCFDAASLITLFDNFLNCYPEEMWRLDIERKYVRTFTGKVYDNCKLADTDGNTKLNTRFLKEMMQGRKKYQRRQWVRDLGIYFGSKYMLSNVRNNTIEMVCYTPDAPIWNSNGYSYLDNGVTKYRPFVAGDFTFYGENNNRKLYKCIESNTDTTFISSKWVESVTPDYKLKITPYLDMYINVAVGNGNLRTPLRAVAGQEYTVDCTSSMNETRVYIYAGSYIQALSGLAPFYIGANIFSSAARLKTLDLGTDNPYYHNTNLKALTILPNMPILETLNIKNCDSLNTPINLSESNNLKVVEAEGSVIPSLSLPAYTSIETLHLPSTVNTLTLLSARKLTSFYMMNKETGLEDYSSLINMNINDSDYSSNINWMTIALAALPHLNALYLRELKTASILDITDLEPFAERKEELETQYDDQGNLINKLNLSGILNIIGSWSTIERDTYGGTSNSIWPGLSFNTNPNNEVTRWKVVYKYDDYENDDGETVEGAEIKTLYVRGNTRIPDIFYDGTITEEPHRDSSVRYEYSFGVHSYGNYVENSGWKPEGAEGENVYYTEMPLATKNMVVETYFTPIARRYQVKWFMKRNDPTSLVKTSTSFVDYGGGENLEAPTIQEIHEAGQETAIINSLLNGVVKYSIFKGWEKLPIEIHPAATDVTYNIYADWEVSPEIPLGELFADTTNLTPELLFVYAHMSLDERRNYAGSTKIGVSQQITFSLGHDSVEEGQMIIGPEGSLVNGILRLDMTPTPRTTSIKPMQEDDDAFTIMIDYSFNPNNPTRYNSKSAGILMSCYYQNSSTDVISGFALYDNLDNTLGSTGPRVGFGNMFGSSNYSRSVGGKSQSHDARNILVLRHPKGEDTLYIYSGLSSSNKINSSVASQEIDWNNSTNNANLVFGLLTDSTDDEYTNLKDITTAANATIYLVKYWNKDLGVGECKRLAAWPHETMTFGIAKINNNITSGDPRDNNPSPSLGLNTLTTSSYGHLYEDTSALGWGSSLYRTIVNNHAMLGLPTKLQAILNKPKVKYLTLTSTEYNGITTKVLSSVASSQNDYLFFPSVYNINSSLSKYSQETNAVSFEASPYPWINSSNVTVYDYSTGGTNGNWNLVSSSNVSNYMNLRFSIKPLKPSTRIFRETANSFSTGSSTTIYALILTAVSNIEVGDIFIDITGNGYMYVSNEDINQLGAQVQPNTGIFACLSGGWIKSSGFWTRSMMEPDMYTTNTSNHMVYSNKSSNLVTAYNSNNAVSSDEGLGLNYSITI